MTTETATDVTTEVTPEAADSTVEVTDVSHGTSKGGEVDGATAEAVAALTPEQITQLEEMLPLYQPKLKINGAEKSMSYDDVLAEAQKAAAANEKFQKAAEIEKRAMQLERQAQDTQSKLERFMQLMKENPALLAREAGVSEKEYRESAEKYLYEQLQRDQMSPEDRAIYEKAAAYDKQQEELQGFKDKEAANAQAQQVERYRQEFDQKMTTALTELDVPDASKPFVVKQVASHLHSLIGQGIENPDVAKVTQLVVDKMNEGVNQYVSNLGADDLKTRLSKDQLAALRKAQIESVQTPQDKLNVAQSGASTKKSSTKGISSREWKEHSKKLMEEWV